MKIAFLFCIALTLSGCATVAKKAVDLGKAALKCAPPFAACIATEFKASQ